MLAYFAARAPGFGCSSVVDDGARHQCGLYLPACEPLPHDEGEDAGQAGEEGGTNLLATATWDVC